MCGCNRNSAKEKRARMYSIFFLMAILGLIFHRSKVVSFIVGLYIIILASLNSNNPDYHSYFLIYNNPATAQEEFGFRFLCTLGNKLGMSYDVFHFIIIIIGFYFLFKGVYYLRKRVSTRFDNIFLVSYMFFPLMNDIVLVRSFLSACLIIYSLHFLYDNKYIKYIVVVLLATTIHVSSLFFLILLLKSRVKREDNYGENQELSDEAIIQNRKYRRHTVLIFILIFVTVIILLRSNVLQALMGNAGFNTLKIELWLSGNTITLRKIIFCAVLHLVNFAVFFFVRRYNSKNDSASNTNDFIKFENILFVLNCAMLINIILTVYSDQFLRLLGIGVMINSIYYMIIIGKERHQLRRIALLFCSITPAVLLFVLRMFGYQTPTGQVYFDYIFKEVIDNNFIFQIFS